MLDFQLTALKKNGNQTISELEMMVEVLEGTAADHESRISAAETDIDGEKTRNSKLGF